MDDTQGVGDEAAAHVSEPHQALTLPTLDELLAEVDDADSAEEAARHEDELQYIDDFEIRSAQNERAWAHLQGLQDHYRHKGTWSQFLMWVLGGMIGFQWALLGMVGFGWWDFSAYQWLLPILLVQNLGQIIGLAFVVVKSLFKDLDHKS
ncbi:hypothetical protein [Paracoccus sp. (in: a-proteobacteria)]|uniref:hypothetical protein n=1 Tax=Paracoccus sp. TaxID=267 RepID=UPI0032427CA3